jgi:hypothetical protein
MTEINPHILTRERFDAMLKEVYADFDSLYRLAAETNKGAAVNLSHRINGRLSVLLLPTAVTFKKEDGK